MLSLKALIFRNWALKLTAFLLACLMWLAVASEQFEKRLIPNVNLEFRNKPENLEIVGPVAGTFEVELLTPIRKNILETDLAIVIDLAGAHAGNRVFTIGPEAVRIPDDVELLRVNPSRVVLTLERSITKEVPVQVKFEGNLPKGLMINQVIVRPPAVSISGTATRISRINHVTAEAINLSARSGSFVTSANVIDESATVRIDRLEPVEVTVEIAEERRNVRVPDIPVEIRGAAVGTRLRPDRVTAIVSVPISFMQTLRAEYFLGVVNVEDLSADQIDQAIEPQISLRDSYKLDVKLVGVDPPAVKVYLPRR
jgi:YbbR domain-containing protein